jgi:threonine/homoserine/homoserine lactone efflux protein
MHPFLFLRGLAIGFALAAPVGPVGVLCIRRVLAEGRNAALGAGLGAALADTIFGAIAGLGLSVISSFLTDHQSSIRLLGGFFLVVLGLRGLKPAAHPLTINGERCSKEGWLKDFFCTFAITLSNPATILAAVGVFAALGAIGLQRPAAAGILIVGVFLGSSAWWLLLSTATGAVRERFSPIWLNWVNRTSGALIAATGVAILASLAIRYLPR